MRLSVVIPAYNEEARLPSTLARVREHYDERDEPYEVIVVSDGSTDGTVPYVQSLEAEWPQLRLIPSQPNRGKGYVVRLGMLDALGERVLFCDADGATPPEEDAKLIARLDAGADVAIGSRPLRESALEIRQPLWRELLGRSFNAAVQTVGVRGIADTQCGFKLFTRDAAQAVFSRVKVDGFGFDFELLMIARDLGLRIDEVGVRWRHQEGSKVNMVRDGSRMLKDLLRLRLAGRTRRTAVREPD